MVAFSNKVIGQEESSVCCGCRLCHACAKGYVHTAIETSEVVSQVTTV